MEVLAYINHHIEIYGFHPTIRKICEDTGLRSSSTVQKHIRLLERDGLLPYARRQFRAHCLASELSKSQRALAESQALLDQKDAIIERLRIELAQMKG